MQNLKLSEINIYPVKSFGGISLKETEVTKIGLKNDRLFILVDENNHFITQRQFPKLSTIKTTIETKGINLFNKEIADIFIPFNPKEKNYIEVKVWRSTCKALVADESINKKISAFLSTNCKIAFMPEETKRSVNPDYDVLGNSNVSFADGYPFLIISEESLNELNSKLEKKILMNRFRPNIVISGGIPFQEDTWTKIKIGTCVFHIVKPCERCVVTTIEQESGLILDKEPLKTLASFRTINNKVIFGQNMLVENTGIIKLGDSIEILS